MRNVSAGLAALAVASLLISPFAYAGDNNLSYLAKDDKPIKVYLKDFGNESGQSQIQPEDFKKALEHALLNRRAVNFRIAQSAEAADIQISATIKKYLYSKTDPVTPSVSPWMLALDAATTENYAEMAAEFTVTDAKTGKALWNGTVSAFIKHMMTPAESVPKIYEKLSRVFLWKSFGKPK